MVINIPLTLILQLYYKPPNIQTTSQHPLTTSQLVSEDDALGTRDINAVGESFMFEVEVNEGRGYSDLRQAQPQHHKLWTTLHEDRYNVTLDGKVRCGCRKVPFKNIN